MSNILALLREFVSTPYPEWEEIRLVLADAFSEIGEEKTSKYLRYWRTEMIIGRDVPYKSPEYIFQLAKIEFLKYLSQYGQVKTNDNDWNTYWTDVEGISTLIPYIYYYGD